MLNFIFLNSFVINSTCLNVDKAFSNNFLILGKISKTVGGEATSMKEGVVMSGDGRHDSMGHSAKFCAYTMLCSTLGKIIHFNLVQVSKFSDMW